MIKNDVERKLKAMLTPISWPTFLKVTGTAIFIYYLILFLRFFPSGFRFSLSGRDAPAPAGQYPEGLFYNDLPEGQLSGENGNLTPRGVFAPETHTDFNSIEELVERIKSALTLAAGQETGDTRPLYKQLRHILRGYPELQNSPYRPSVNEFIATESELLGAGSISEATADTLWPD